MIFKYTDNVTYGTDALNNGTMPILEASTYEVPVSSSASAGVTRAVRTEPDHEYELTDAIPNVDEYATLGPNEQVVT